MLGGMHTPWGVASTQQQLDEGVFRVSTAENGGILIERETAKALLSEKALRVGKPWYGFLAFEQEHDMMVVLYEQPQWYWWVEEELTEKFARESIVQFHPEYFAE